MSKHIPLVLALAMAFVLACSVFTSPPVTEVPVAVLSTFTPLATYTPLPTYTAVPVEATVYVAPTATIKASPTANISPKFPSELIKPNIMTYGDTTLANDMWYFIAQAGQNFYATSSGENYHQSYSLRDDTNDGLIGCDLGGGKTCVIANFKLPYSGLYYILVDRTLEERYKKSATCTSNPPFPNWCFRGGKYTITITIQ